MSLKEVESLLQIAEGQNLDLKANFRDFDRIKSSVCVS
jgi:hypothetical protein